MDIYLNDQLIESLNILHEIGRGYEWCGELWGKVVSGLIIIEDLLILRQYVSAFGVNSGIKEHKRSSIRHESLFHYAKLGRIQGKQLLGWIHSHDTMRAFLSFTDRGQIEDVYLKEIPFVVSLVISLKPMTYIRRRFGFFQKNKKLPFTIKVWIDGVFNKTHYRWHGIKLQPGKNFNFTVLTEESDKLLEGRIREDYSNMVNIQQSNTESGNLTLNDFFT